MPLNSMLLSITTIKIRITPLRITTLTIMTRSITTFRILKTILQSPEQSN
jgi:hypothetical protein